jgi:hypothetical protein
MRTSFFVAGAALALLAACSDDERSRNRSPGSTGTGGATASVSSSTGEGAQGAQGGSCPETGTGSLELSWVVDRGPNCPAADSVMQLSLYGPTSVTDSVPCTDYAYTFTQLAPCTYALQLMLDFSSGTIVFELSGIPIGNGPFAFGPLDMGECSIMGCGPDTVGCNDDGMCAPDDDCTCVDCMNDAQCGGCVDDAECRPYFESCACTDCTGDPACL